MSRIEERVVSMKFDNKQFASAAGETLGLLDKLKSAMNFKRLGSAISGAGFKEVDRSARSAADSVKMVSSAAQSVDLSGLSGSVAGVSSSISALGAIGFGAFASIGASAASAAASIAKSFTITPVLEGFNEYETKINAIQRIQANTASKGIGMDKITSSLDNLNLYADQTIYNFGEMTDAIARFTSAGVDLDTSTASIKGLSNVAALAGATAAESAQVNKQVAQALGGGDVRLQDWMSVENAGMDNEAFKTALFEAGKNLKELGDVPVDQSFEEWTKSGNKFRDSLKDGWLTTDVLTEALKNMTGDLSKEDLMKKGYSEKQADALVKTAQAAKSAASDVKTFSQMMDTLKESTGSAWTGMFESIFGGLEESKALFTGLTDTFSTVLTAFPNKVSAVFDEWAKLGGKTTFFDGMKDGLKFVLDLLRPIGDAFKEVFEPFTGGDLKNATDSFAEFTSKLKVSKELAAGIKTVFTVIFNAVKLAAQGFSVFIKAVGLAVGVVARVVGTLLEFVGAIFAVDAADGASVFEGIKSALSGIAGIGGKVVDLFRNIGKAVMELFNFGDGMSLGDVFADMFASIGKMDVAGMIGNVFGFIGDAISSAFDAIRNIDPEVLIGAITAVFAGAGFMKIKSLADKFLGILDDVSTSIKDAISNIKGEAEDADTPKIDMLSESLMGLGKAFLVISAAAVLFAGAMLIMSKIPLKQMTPALVGLAGAVVVLGVAMKLLGGIVSGMSEGLGKIDKKNGVFTNLLTSFDNLVRMAGQSMMIMSLSVALIAVAAAILILSVAMERLSKLSWEEIAKGLVSIAGLMLILAAAVKLMPEKKLVGVAMSLIVLSVAVRLMAGAVERFSSMSWDEMLKGFTALSAMLAGLVLASRYMDDKSMIRSATSLVILAAAVNLLALAFQKMSGVSWEDMLKGFVTLAVTLTAFTTAAKFLDNVDLSGIAGSILILSVAMYVMAAALTKMNGVSWESMAKGFLSIAVSLGTLGVASDLVSPSDIMKTASSMLVVAVALGAMAAALGMFAMVSWEEMAKGLVSVVGVLTAMGVASELVDAGDLLKLSVAMVGVSVGMGAIALALAAMGAVDAVAALESVGIIAAVMLTLTGVMAIMDKASSTGGGGGLVDTINQIVKIAGTMVAAAVGITALSIALSLFAGVMERFAGMGAGGMAAGFIGVGIAIGIVVAAGYLLQPLIPVFLAVGASFLAIGAAAFLVGAGFFLFGAGLLQAVTALTALSVAGGSVLTMLPLLGAALAGMVVGFIASLALMAPAIGAAFVALGVVIITSITQLIPQVLALVGTLITGILNLVITMAPLFGQTLIALITTLCEVIISTAPIIGEALLVVITEAISVLDAALPVFGDFIIRLIEEIARVVVESADTLITAFVELLSLVVEGLIDSAHIIGAAGPEIIAAFLTGFMDAITESIPQVVDAFLRLLNAGVDGILEAQSGLTDAVVRLLEGLAEAIREDGPRIRAAFKELLDAAKDELLAGISGFVQIGVDIVMGLWEGLKSKFAEVTAWFGSKVGELKEKAKSVLNINSPSRVFMEIGGYVSEGLALGIKNNNRPNKEMGRTSKGVINEAEKTLEIHSPSRVFQRIGSNVNEGFAQGLDKTSHMPANAMGRTLDGVINTADTKGSVLDGILTRIATLTPLTAEINAISKEATKTRKEALEQRAKDAKEEEKRLDDQILDARDALADHKDSIKDAEDQKAERKAEAGNAKKDASAEKGKAKEAKKSASAARRDADKSRRDAAKADRDLARKRRDTAKKEKALREAEEEKAAYDANIKGYLAGKAFAEGTKSGLSDAHEEILSEEEIFVNLLSEKIKEYKDEFSDFTGLFDGMKDVRDIVSSTTDNVDELGRAFTRLNTSTSGPSTSRALGDILDSLIGIGDAFEKIFDLFDKIKPFIVPLMGALNAAMPAIAAFAPALAAGGAVGAAPVIAAIGGITLAFVGLVAFFDDFNKDQKIARVLTNLIDNILKFIGSIPRRIAQLIRSVGEGMVKFIRFLPDFIPSLIKGILDALVEIVIYLPAILAELVIAIFDVLIELLTNPEKLFDMVVRIGQAFVEAFWRLITGLSDQFAKIGERMGDHIVSGFKRVGEKLMYWLNPLNWFKPREVSDVKDLGELYGDEYKNGFLDAINNVYTMQDLNPTIKPAIDLTELESGVKKANDMMDFDTKYGARLASDINAAMSPALGKDDENGSAGNSHTTIEYTQNISSPTPLSTVDIYRNTQKQLMLQGSMAGTKTINSANAVGSIGSTDIFAGGWLGGLLGRK